MQHLTAQQCARAYSRTHPALPRLTLLFRPERSHNYSSNSHLPTPPPTQHKDVEQIHSIHERNFAAPTLASLNYFRRVLTYSLVGLAALAATTLTAFEGVHQWVEHVELGADADSENKRWGWTQEAERWSGGSARGGTDPALGFKARHAVRGAWIAQHWGTGGSVTRASAIDGARPSSGVSAVSAGLELAHDFLNIALNIAISRQKEKKDGGGGMREQTVPELLTRHASILERMGSNSRAFLLDARKEYERVWAASGGQGVDAARLAAKLGDVCARLGDGEEAIEWWQRASSLLVTPPPHSSPSPSNSSSPSPSESSKLPTSSSKSTEPPPPFPQHPILPESLPSSALGQRTLASIAPSLSAHYVQAGDLAQAKRVQEAGLNLLQLSSESNLTTTTSPAQMSSAETLHDLYLAHRASLLSLHLAEVTYALKEGKESARSALDRLRSAARASERVAGALTGEPFLNSGYIGSNLSTASSSTSTSLPPPSPDKALDKQYASSRTLRSPATSLLRDARRTAVEAWTLAGILCEQQTTSTPSRASQQKQQQNSSTPAEEALDCYSRALAWAGVGGSENLSGMGRPGEGTLEREWEALWGRYVRVRDVVRGQRQRQNEQETKK